jgi:hypothetical protein
MRSLIGFTKKKFEKFLYYHWIQKSIQIDSKDPRPKKKKTKILDSLGQLHVSIHSYSLHNHNWHQFIWEDFSNF